MLTSYTWNDHQTEITMDEAFDYVIISYLNHKSGCIEKSSPNQIVPDMYLNFNFSKKNRYIDLMESENLPISEQKFWENLKLFLDTAINS